MRQPPPAIPGKVNHDLLDRFTLVHFLVGVAYGLLGLGFVAALVLALLWELVENPMKAYVPRIFPNATKDTLRNSVGDTVAVMLGWACVRFFG